MTSLGVAGAMRVAPAATFPARIAVARVQDRSYRSYSAEGRDYGSFSLLGARDVETQEAYEKVTALPMVESVVQINDLVMSPSADGMEGLREAAGRVQADMLAVYTFDTTFGVETTVPALGVITLGLFPNDQARVNTVASMALIDTRTGFVYGLASARDEERQIANAWTNRDAVDQSRRRAEQNAFDGLVDEFSVLWKGVVDSYAVHPPQR